MISKVGLWIDHRKCIIVFVYSSNIEKKIITSHAEKHLSRSHGKSSAVPFESQMVKADDRQARHFTGQLNTYYDEVISYLDKAESILIFGPGEAKTELLKRTSKHKLKATIEALENADKMTDDQIIAKVKQHNFK